jgi:ABC-2 type transport system permease protein
LKNEYNTMKYLNFLREVVTRDIKKKYYKSVLGVVWAVLNPLMMMVVITIVFSTVFKRNIDNFPVYYLCGSLIFSFNSDATNQALTCIIGNSALIRKMYIPKYMFCISKVIVSFVTLLFSLVALAVVMLITGCKFTIYTLLIPVPLVYVFMFTTGLSLILATYGVFFRDLKHLYGILITAWMYITPIFYPVSIIPEKFRFIWDLNPLYHYATIMRDVVYVGTMPSEKSLIIGTCFSVLTLLIGIITFKENEDRFFLYI